MIADKIFLNDNLEEILPHTEKEFAHTSYYEETEKFAGGYVPWHWHKDVEMKYIVSGSIKLTTNLGEYILNAGEGMFINSNVLHLEKPVKGEKVIVLDQVFDASIISGQIGSVFQQKYVDCITHCRDLDVMIFKPSHVRQRKIIDAIRNAQDFSDEHAYGYEIFVRNELSTAWLYMCQEAEEKINNRKIVRNVGEERLKAMILYIQKNYMKKILLSDIASAASVGEREALRVFKHQLGTTPFSYLLEYRVQMAAAKLKETNHTVAMIAYECGFSSPSYMGKVFREIMGCTPLSYKGS